MNPRVLSTPIFQVPLDIENAQEQDPQEAKRSEREAREHAKEEDPAVHRDYEKPVN